MEWDWRLQDGIGTPREPRTFAEAVVSLRARFRKAGLGTPPKESADEEEWRALHIALRAHALKNSLLPIIAFLASTAAEMLAGCIVIEQIFSLPGIGRLLMVSISNRDIPVVEAIVMILAVWVMVVHFVGEVVSEMLDPRLRV